MSKSDFIFHAAPIPGNFKIARYGRVSYIKKLIYKGGGGNAILLNLIKEVICS